VRRRELLLTLACAGVGCRRASSAPAGKDELVDIGGRRLHAQIWGSGAPVVVIDVGFAEAVEPWAPVISRLAAEGRVCAYERAGYGRSDGGPYPRTAKHVTSDLRLLLSKLALPPPYVLVGHSLGALHMMVLAAESPDLAGAMLLLDPPPRRFISREDFPGLVKMASQQTAEFQRMAKEAREQNAIGKAVFFETLASEHEAMFSQSAAQVARVLTFGELPLTVVASGVPNARFGPDAEAFQQFWIESSRQVAGLSRRGKFLVAGKSTHQIQRDAPDLVAREALELVSACPKRGGGGAGNPQEARGPAAQAVP
jgi:pimeloyl-ACP methyl ester carboxylesterase